MIFLKKIMKYNSPQAKKPLPAESGLGFFTSIREVKK
jgi:hypothetical protein